tara:strand:- start:492 stop:710 length:219 start_codon:yes stop_codon:yes gene_type:complete
MVNLTLLTSQEYVEKLGLACPNCQSTQGVDGISGVQTDDGIAWQEIECTLCSACWLDNYTLVGYSELEVMGV